MTEKEKTKRNLKLVKSQIQEVNQVIEEMLGRKINKELWNCIQTLIIKTQQYHRLEMDIVRMDLETKVKPIIEKYNEEIGQPNE